MMFSTKIKISSLKLHSLTGAGEGFGIDQAMSNGKGKVDRDASAGGSDKITILNNAIANILVIAHLCDNATMARDT